MYSINWWNKFLWKIHSPLKVKRFCWLALNDKILVWENLKARGVVGPDFCFLCREEVYSSLL